MHLKNRKKGTGFAYFFFNSMELAVSKECGVICKTTQLYDLQNKYLFFISDNNLPSVLILFIYELQLIFFRSIQIS